MSLAATGCPFSSADYLRGLIHVGAPIHHPSADIVVLRRDIPGSGRCDGLGPWPYRWMRDCGDLDRFRTGFPDLVSLAVVTHPGWIPPADQPDIRLLKWHFVYDPDRPTPTLSRRACTRLNAAEKVGRFDRITGPAAAQETGELYRQLVLRRGLTGGHFDLPPDHFHQVARLAGSFFVRVSDDHGTGAIACGVVLGNFLQVLHFVTTETGLTWNASYLLMSALQQDARQRGLLLLTGGMPAAGAPGLQIFKSRWTNACLPVHLLCIVNDKHAYAELSGARVKTSTFFPAYRDTV